MLLSHTKPRADQNQAIDAEKLKTIAYVDGLHQLAQQFDGEVREFLEGAAVHLDEIQAGYVLHTPHESTGYELVVAQAIAA